MFSEKRTSIYDTVPNTGQGSASPKFNNIFEREQLRMSIKLILEI